MEKNTALEAVSVLLKEAEDLNARTNAAVHAALAAGASWNDLGTVMGTSKQTAYNRFKAARPVQQVIDNPTDATDEEREAAAALQALQAVAARKTAEEAAKKIDAPAPAARKKRTPGTTPEPEPMPEYRNVHNWDDETNPWKQDDPKHFLQTKKQRPERCIYCGGSTHRLPNGGTWIYAGCSPTRTDPIYTS